MTQTASNGTVITDEIRNLFRDYKMALDGFEQHGIIPNGSVHAYFDFCEKCGNYIPNRYCGDCQVACIRFLVDFRKENKL
jgi:hypothetical protein